MNQETKNMPQERCPQCGNHCPADALKCPRGRRYFGIQEENGEENHSHMGEENHNHMGERHHHHRHHEGHHHDSHGHDGHGHEE